MDRDYIIVPILGDPESLNSAERGQQTDRARQQVLSASLTSYPRRSNDGAPENSIVKLRFYAKDDQLVSVPGARRMVGQAPQYVGRQLVRNEGAAPQYRATEEPFECESETDEGRELLRRFRAETNNHGDQPLWPADEETAKECGVAFQRVAVKDGIAVVVKTAQKQPQAETSKL